MRLVLASLLATTACGTYDNHRAALVPHAAPTMFDGQPMTNVGQVAVGADNLFDLAKPTAGDSTQGDQVPQHQLHLSAALRGQGDMVSVSGVFERALVSNSTVINSDAPRITDAGLTGAGVALRLAIPTSTPGLRIGMAIEGVVWSVPWVQFSTCAPNCGSIATDKADLVPTLGIAFIPSYKFGRVTLFGGATMRNQPTIAAETYTVGAPDQEGPDVGSWTFTAHGGVAVDVGSGVKATAIVHDTFGGPIAYGPSVAVELSIPLGDQAKVMP